MTNHFRFPVAIKSPKRCNEREVIEFLNEAKSMLEVSVYHENIVNLQGITYTKMDRADSTIKVCSLVDFFSVTNLS